jgi:uncharacterized hydrophobic protein (TIGR00271 family)
LETFFDKFRLKNEKEELQTVISNIDNGVVFRGTNLWVLIFAIFVASLGLNLNSTAVIIGAMLISPLMGPIMGIGLGVGINDVALLRKALYNYFVATIVALTTSTVFFLISPINDPHAEILARTSPNVYDVLIALFGGFAGIIAISSKQKGNVIPGVAIATALMPPLCTAGYGIATLQYSYFIGAFYLYIINTVFIMLATFIIVRILHFPYKHLQNKKAERIAQRVVWSVVLLTLLPSIYFAYDMVEQTRFSKYANRFIQNEAHFPNDYLLSKKIDGKNKKIILVFGGKEISRAEIETLKISLNKYNLSGVTLEVKQGFAYLTETNNKEQNEQLAELTKALGIEEEKARTLQHQIDSIRNLQALGNQVYQEIKSQHPSVYSAIIQPVRVIGDSSGLKSGYIVSLSLSGNLSWFEKVKLENWLKVRLNEKNINLIIQQ